MKSQIVIIVVCNVLGLALGQEPALASFGDFMEFDVGLHRSCENNPGGANTTWEIITSFSECTHRVPQAQPKDIFDGMMAICQNRAKYFDCWEKMKATVMEKCGKDKEPLLPAVYRVTVSSLCGSDNGAATIATLKSAFAEIRPDDQSKCPEETGIHWIENCKDLLPTMSSGDLCARHAAIDKCVKKTTCDNVKFARVTREVYSNGRPHLQCNERKA